MFQEAMGVSGLFELDAKSNSNATHHLQLLVEPALRFHEVCDCMMQLPYQQTGTDSWTQ
jgi:hypothetical protein